MRHPGGHIPWALNCSSKVLFIYFGAQSRYVQYTWSARDWVEGLKLTEFCKAMPGDARSTAVSDGRQTLLGGCTHRAT